MAHKERAADPRAVNIKALCKDRASLSGDWPLSAMTRLADSLFGPQSGAVAWSAACEEVPALGAEPELWMQLGARTQVQLQCQRCLKGAPQELVVDRRFRFARTEQEAEELDEALEDDVLALAPRLDLQELVEDELILALPLVARHEGECPEPLPLPLDDLGPAETTPNPFAALAALKNRN